MYETFHGGKREGAGRPRKGDHVRSIKLTLNDEQNDYILDKLAAGYKLAEILEELIDKEIKKRQNSPFRKGSV